MDLPFHFSLWHFNVSRNVCERACVHLPWLENFLHAAFQQIRDDVLDCTALMFNAAPCRPARPDGTFPKFYFPDPSEEGGRGRLIQNS